MRECANACIITWQTQIVNQERYNLYANGRGAQIGACLKSPEPYVILIFSCGARIEKLHKKYFAAPFNLLTNNYILYTNVAP